MTSDMRAPHYVLVGNGFLTSSHAVKEVSCMRSYIQSCDFFGSLSYLFLKRLGCRNDLT